MRKSSAVTIAQRIRVLFGLTAICLLLALADQASDQAVWRAGTPATFYINRSMLGFVALTFGQTGDAVPGWSLQVR